MSFAYDKGRRVIVPSRLARGMGLPAELYTPATLRLARAIEGKIRELQSQGIDPGGKDGVAHVVLHPDTEPLTLTRIGPITIHRRHHVPLDTIYVLDEDTFRKAENEGARKWRC